MADLDNQFKIFGQTEVAGLADEKPVRLVVEGLAGELIFLTNIRGGVSPNFQLMYSIGAKAFINTFSQRLSMFELSGLYIPNTCETGEVDREPAFLTFYDRRNIVNSSQPIRISYNNIVITGFLVNLDIKDYNQQGIDGHAFTLKFLGKLENIRDRNTVSGSLAAAAQSVKDELAAQSASVKGSLSAAYNTVSGSQGTVRTGTVSSRTSTTKSTATNKSELAIRAEDIGVAIPPSIGDPLPAKKRVILRSPNT